MNILIKTPPYRHNSAGVIVLHYLGHLLNELGNNAYMTTDVFNKEWNEKEWKGEQIDLIIVPEIYSETGNIGCKVVRWCLNAPGRLAGPTEYGEHEQVFYYNELQKEECQRATKNEVKKFRLPVINGDLYNGVEEKDIDGIFYIGKGKKTIDFPDMMEITRDFPITKEKLIAILKRCKRFYSFDDYTSTLDDAVLCGCETFVVTDKIKPYIQPKEKYLMDKEEDLKTVSDFLANIK